MCGIGGKIGEIENFEATPEIFLSEITRRGPDDSGVELFETGFFVHTRLSIIDVSMVNHQPFRLNHRYCLSFNGEIYNYRELASKHLNDIEFVTTGDTEVLYYLLIRYGVKKTCLLLKGMFAFAFYDSHTKKLSLARDIFGEKPLYYTIGSGGIAFSSTLSALIKSRKKNNLNKKSINELMSFGFVGGAESIIQGIYKLEPSCYLEWSEGSVTIHEYFNRDQTFRQKNTTEDDVEDLILKSVERQSVSDVPLGSFLSGGIDSSLITAMLAQTQTKKIDTFTIGFSDKKLNEAPFARRVANYLGTNHHEEIIDDQRLLSIVGKLPEVYDEPFADSSQIPTLLVSEVARNKVTVVLSGDGGDELFGGYSRYILGKNFNRIFHGITPIGRKIALGLIGSVPNNILNQVFTLYSGKEFNGFNDKIDRLKTILRNSNPDKYYEYALRHWQDKELKNTLNSHLSFTMNKKVPKFIRIVNSL